MPKAKRKLKVQLSEANTKGIEALAVSMPSTAPKLVNKATEQFLKTQSKKKAQ